MGWRATADDLDGAAAGDRAQLARRCAPNGRIASTLVLSSEQVERDRIVATPVVAAPTTGTTERELAA